jgi:hypothetical protein
MCGYGCPLARSGLREPHGRNVPIPLIRDPNSSSSTSWALTLTSGGVRGSSYAYAHISYATNTHVVSALRALYAPVLTGYTGSKKGRK